MTQIAKPIQVYLEIGQTRIFAVALEWPGWSRSGRDEASALQSLFDYGPRYARALQAAHLPFHPPENISDLLVVDRLAGTTTTDFGSPAVAPSQDAAPVDLSNSAGFWCCWKSAGRRSIPSLGQPQTAIFVQARAAVAVIWQKLSGTSRKPKSPI